MGRNLNINDHFVDENVDLNIVRKKRIKKPGHKVELSMSVDGTHHSMGGGHCTRARPPWVQAWYSTQINPYQAQQYSNAFSTGYKRIV